MSGASAFGRLLWRPAMLLMSFPLLWSFVGAALVIGEALGSAVIPGFRSGRPSPALLHYALVLGITLPAAAGLMAAMASLELQFTGMAWTLPGLRRRLATELTIFAVLPAALVAWLAGRADSLPVAISAFLLTMAWLSATLIVCDAAQPRWLRMVLAALFAASLLEPAAYVAIVTSYPALTGAAGLAAAAAMLGRHAAPGIMRRRPFTSSSFSVGVGGAQLWWAERGDGDAGWAGSLVGASTGQWLRAAAYETGGMTRYGWRGVAAGHATLALGAYVMSPGMVLMAALTLAFSGVQLRLNVPYPLSRKQRARLFYLGNLADVLVVTGVYGAVLFTLAALGVPQMDAERPAYELPTLLAFAFILAPIVQWARVRGPLPRAAMQRVGRHLIFPAVAMIVGLPAAIFLIRTMSAEPMRLALTLAGMAVIAQAVHWFAVQWFYRRADLGTAM